MNGNVLGRLTIVYTTGKLPWEDSGSIIYYRYPPRYTASSVIFKTIDKDLKKCIFKILTPKDFRAPFPIELSPQENPLLVETSP